MKSRPVSALLWVVTWTPFRDVYLAVVSGHGEAVYLTVGNEKLPDGNFQVEHVGFDTDLCSVRADLH